jgi:chemotaxis receptor (MCP) glutamine deamidase CheD
MPDDTRYPVAAGSYCVDTQKPIILEAYLGTCVGVALYDPVAGVGGLIHLLLPEPMGIEGTFQPEKYASTGFPPFLQALADAGASAENMKACIAGGALVGPIDDSDLELDIGGRTAERVMRTWECRIEPAGFDKLSTSVDIKIPEPNEISLSAKNLQPIPQIALKVLRILNEELYEIQSVTEEIRKDQVISARTLQLCNSAMFAIRGKIESLDHALVMLGKHLLLKFVIAASLNNFFDQTGMGYSLCKGGIYHHAVGTAVIAEKLADVTGKVEPSFLSGIK